MRLIERQGLVEPIAVIGHATAVKLLARIAAKRVAADLTPALSAGRIRSRAVAEIESWTNVGADVGSAVIPLVPTRVRIEWVRFSVNRHVIQPELSRVVSALHDIENAEAIKHRAIGFVAGVESHDVGVAAEDGGDSAQAGSAIGIVVEGERVVGCAAGKGRLSAERRAASSPQPSAILEIRVKISPSAVDAQGKLIV
jgi:hypothetical protein